jgi:hypothetical protein
MIRLAAVYSGASVHHRSLRGERYKELFDELIYLPKLAAADLHPFRGILIPCRMHLGLLEAARSNLETYLQGGGVVIALGEQPMPLLPGVTWEDRETNFWWWLDPDATSPLHAPRADHSLFRYLRVEDATWHFHGVFHPPPGAEALICTDDGASVVYVDSVTTAGTMVISSLDPMYHFGSYFMPAAERFLDGFLHWVVEELLA